MASLPSGTVTFLFTDIEGSTRLWESDQAGMHSVLARHDGLLREGIESHGGYVFKTIGDAFCAAFPTATQALTAALGLQRALCAEEALSSLRVRMALHTGAAEERSGDYFGLPLSRVARLLSAGHGEQVLLSRVTQELVHDSLPSGLGLRDLGEHRLKDLTRRERIYQLTAPDLPSEFPPLRALDACPHNLPVQPTPLIGREREIEEVRRRILQKEVRLLTLTGPGGVGKTRLAIQAAAELIEEFRDGTFVVNLAPLGDPVFVPSAIAHVLGLQETGAQPASESLPRYLHDKQMLLLLDNFEQVVESASDVAHLLASAPELQVLVTSRVSLHLRGEQEYPVPTLSLPEAGHLPRREHLTRSEAVRLFVERARGVLPAFELTDENAPAVAEICHRLDGLPLAIELVAARIRTLPPQAILSRLQSRLKLLTGGARDLPPRQRTLRGTIEWSYNLLDESERVLFGRLAVFSGGRTLEAIEQVCSGEGDLGVDVLDGVSSLVDKNLLRQEGGVGGEPRFVMLETIHEYADEKLEEDGEADALRRRHAEYFLVLAEAAEPQLHGREAAEWLERLEQEHNNFRAALAWYLAAEDGALPSLRLASALRDFWFSRGHLPEGSAWLEKALARSAGIEDPVRAKALNGAGSLAFFRGDLARSQLLAEESLALSRRAGDEVGVVHALSTLEMIASDRGEHDRARALAEEALPLARAEGEKRLISNLLNNMGVGAYQRGDYRRARERFEEALALKQEIGNEIGLDIALNNLAEVALAEGDVLAAATYHRRALGISSRLGKKGSSVASGLEGLAAVYAAQQAPERAARLYGAAAALREAEGFPREPADQPRYERQLAAVREALGEDVFAAFWAEGRAMPLEEAIAYALEDGGSAGE